MSAKLRSWVSERMRKSVGMFDGPAITCRYRGLQSSREPCIDDDRLSQIVSGLKSRFDTSGTDAAMDSRLRMKYKKDRNFTV